MAFKSTLNLTSKIFNDDERRNTFGRVAAQSAKKFKADLKSKMIDSPHTGRITTRGAKGSNFTRRHQASRPGERPAPDTGELVESISDRVISPTAAETSVDAKHGEILQRVGSRQVMTERDVAEAEKDFHERGRRALIDLL